MKTADIAIRTACALVVASCCLGASHPARAASSTAIISTQLGPPRICFDAKGNPAVPTAGTTVQLYPCTGAAKQLWSPEVIDLPAYTTATPAGSSTLRLVNVATNLCLDLQSPSTAAGVGVKYATCNGSDTQRWIVAGRNGGDARQLINKYSNLCLIARNAESVPGHTGDGVAQYPCSFTEIPNPLTVWKISVF